MSIMTQITASDGHALGAYIVKPQGTPKGAVVVVQEIFGVNPSIRSVADDFAAQGYYAIAPARCSTASSATSSLATRVSTWRRPSRSTGCSALNLALKDVAAAFVEAKKTVSDVAVIGFCYGGLMSWLSSTKGPAEGMKPACCVAFYPRRAWARLRTSRFPARSWCTSAPTTATSSRTRSTPSRAPIPRSRSSCTPNPGMVSTILTAPSTTPPRPPWPVGARSSSCAQHLHQ